jgi:predicted AlkP superfamily phosphohydrolase/phosphomutase
MDRTMRSRPTIARRSNGLLRGAILFGALACAWFAPAGCRKHGASDAAPAFLKLPERPVPGRVFLVGIDGASFDVFDEVMAAGVMPNLRRIGDGGARTVLRSQDPTASAILWTTIATGKLPKKHGILGFVAPTGDGKTVPVSSTMRRVHALWNIASEAGVSVGFLSWWVTWPAEPVRGFLATDYVWPLKKDAQGFATGSEENPAREDRTWPRELMKELEPLNVTEARLSKEELDGLGISALPAMQGYAVRDILLKDVSVERMARHLLESGREESLFAVYFDGFDAYCHLFWPMYRDYAAARKGGSAGPDAYGKLDPQKLRIARVLDAHLARIDAFLGFLLDRMRPEDALLIVSDHGYGDNPGKKPVERAFGQTIRPEHWHTLSGILLATGGPIRRGARGFEASVLDVTPTVLALLGLPVARDMDGRPIEALLSERFLEEHPVSRIETYDPTPRAGTITPGAYDEAMKDRLRQLGYVDGAGGN